MIPLHLVAKTATASWLDPLRPEGVQEEDLGKVDKTMLHPVVQMHADGIRFVEIPTMGISARVADCDIVATMNLMRHLADEARASAPQSRIMLSTTIGSLRPLPLDWVYAGSKNHANRSLLPDPMHTWRRANI